MEAATIHLVRHAEVHNPDHVVYADLDGFDLSKMGRAQAAAAGRRLADHAVVAVVTSPLLRALTTAEAIAAHHSVEAVVDPRLTEWRLSSRWAGHVWEELEEAFPGELTAYLEHPTELEFSPEPISTVAARMAEAVGAALVGAAGGEVVVVSHQDPVQAARLALTGRNLTELNEDKPAHAELVTLHRAGEESAWVEQARWRPEQGKTFPPLR